MKASFKRLVVFLAGLSLLSTTFMGVANAAMVGTQSAVDAEQRAERIAEVRDWMARDSVQEKLVELGVDPADASERVSSMTPEELRMMQDRINGLPAGAGAIEVIGIVFLVLLILELVGVTHVFTGI